MKAITLLGSPKKNGNTGTLAALINKELEKRGHTTHQVYLHDKTIKGCLACGKCKANKNTISCIQDDDAQSILAEMVAADLILYTSPLYFWGLAGPLKCLIDRTYSLYTQYHQPDHDSLLKGKRQALLVTGGGPYGNNAEPVFTAFRNLHKPHMTINAGELYIGPCTTPNNFPQSDKEATILFSEKIVF